MMYRVLFALLIAFVVVAQCDEKKPVGNWNVTERGTNNTCIRVQAAISIIVTYDKLTKDNKTEKANGTVFVPTNTTASGDCEAMYIEWKFNNDWRVRFTFNESKKNDEKVFVLSEVAGDYDTTNAIDSFPNIEKNINDSFTKTADNSWPVRGPLGKDYSCVKGDTELHINENVTVRLDELRVQPYSTNNTDFVLGTQCSADVASSDLVPIIVGACLALLVIIVLIAYIVGRIRAKRQGYSSV